MIILRKFIQFILTKLNFNLKMPLAYIDKLFNDKK